MVLRKAAGLFPVEKSCRIMSSLPDKLVRLDGKRRKLMARPWRSRVFALIFTVVWGFPGMLLSQVLDHKPGVLSSGWADMEQKRPMAGQHLCQWQPRTPPSPPSPQTPEQPLAPPQPQSPLSPQAPAQPQAPSQPQAPQAPQQPQAPQEPLRPEQPPQPPSPGQPQAPPGPSRW